MTGFSSAATLSGRYAAAVVAGLIALAPAARAAGDATVIQLTQVPCQFIEPEHGVDHQFTSREKADCEAINARTGAGRLAKAGEMTLKAGSYVFRVTNKNVPYELGFWLRDEGYDWRNPLHKLSKTSVSGGGLTTGKTQDYEVTLKPGKYLFSCPLNTTPDYALVVTE